MLTKAMLKKGEVPPDQLMVLTQDVVNPEPDRRMKHWEKYPKWEKGETFVLSTRRMGKGDIGGICEGGEFLFCIGKSAYGPVWEGSDLPVWEGSDLYDAIRPHLEPVPASLRTLEVELRLEAGTLVGKPLDPLLLMGKITFDDIRRAFSWEECGYCNTFGLPGTMALVEFEGWEQHLCPTHLSKKLAEKAAKEAAKAAAAK